MRTKIVALVMAAMALVGVVVMGATAGAQETPTPVTDYATYPSGPQSLVTPGCDASQLSGVSFTLQRSGAPVGAPVTFLSSLGTLEAGDVVTAFWGATGPACAGTPITLAIKSAGVPVFDAGIDQFTQFPWSSNFGTADAGPGSVTYTLPQLPDPCFYQLDALLGAPLAVVGPNGSFYNPAYRPNGGPNLLISANNGQYATTCGETPQRSIITVPPPVAQVEETTTTTSAIETTTPPATTATVPGGQFGPYTDCTAARLAGYSNILQGSPQYVADQDVDLDGVACETSTITYTSTSQPILAITGASDPMKPLLLGLCTITLGGMFLVIKRLRAPDQA